MRNRSIENAIPFRSALFGVSPGLVVDERLVYNTFKRSVFSMVPEIGCDRKQARLLPMALLLQCW